MEFKKGQKVLCVNDSFRTFCSYPVRKGLVYTIQDLYRCECGSKQVVLFEKPFMSEMRCGCGRINFRRQSYYNWRFIPLEYFEKIIGWSERKENPDKSRVKSKSKSRTKQNIKTN